MKRLSSALIGLVVVLAAAGCGGDGGGDGERLTKAQYEERLQAIDAETTAVGQRLGGYLVQLVTSPSGVDLGEVATSTGATQKVVREAAEEYKALHPPAEAEDLNKRLAAGTRKLANDLDELRSAAEDGDRDGAAELARRLSAGNLDSLQELDAVRGKFRKKDYRLRTPT